MTYTRAMVPSPGTPVGGERLRRRRSNSPAGTAAAAAAGPPDSAMGVDNAGLGVPRLCRALEDNHALLFLLLG